MTPFIRSAYNYNMDEASLESAIEIDSSIKEENLTHQSFKEECDINTIVERFGLTGQLPDDIRMPLTGDFTEVVNDYQTALNMVIAADNEFMKLPANIRERFRNDPAELISFLENEQNRDEAERLGIVNKPIQQDEKPLAANAASGAPSPGGPANA